MTLVGLLRSLLIFYVSFGCAGVCVLLTRLHDGRTVRERLVPDGWRTDWTVLAVLLLWPVWVFWLSRARRRWERAGRPRP